MTYDPYAALDHQLDGYRAQAATLRAGYESKTTDINRDPNLSDQGRQEQIDTWKQNTQNQLNAVRAKEDDAIKSATLTLERSIFGYSSSTNPSENISRRDAEDRAERLEEAGEATALLARAERVNDPHLAQAVVRRAVDQGWTRVLDAYNNEHPGTGEKLQALSRIQNAAANADYTMGRALAYRVQ